MADQPVALERKPLEVLIYLLHHAGEVVTKDEILSNVWPGRVLSETVLTGNISTLRQALRDNEHKLIRTAHGFGYRLDAEVRVEATTTPPPPVFSFDVGDHPPLRPQWKLVERLGTGGHGEAWLARHEKTGDARVFKFALSAASLDSLKREITLYRVLHDSLGERVQVAQILDWNLQEAPYFIEVEYVHGRDLRTWADARGGLQQIPLPERLELIAQIADAVAAAHSVGVLHKDLKPGNVLVDSKTTSPSVRLCDFGSGGVLDPTRLGQLGITKLGFTKTFSGLPSGTPIYLAPEVVAGQPATVKADIYALGVLLYQLIVGSFQKPLAPGWELEVEDRLLQEDVAATCAGDPARRTPEASTLANRLRQVESRRYAREREHAAQQRAQRAQQVSRELNRVKLYALTLALLGLIAAAATAGAIKARNQAIDAQHVSDALNTFLLEDVLSTDHAVDRPGGDSYLATLDRAAAHVDDRLASQPEAAAEVHWLLGRRFQELQRISSALGQYGAARQFFGRIYGPDSEQALLAEERLATLLIDTDRQTEGLDLVRRMRAHWASASRTNSISRAVWRIRLAKLMAATGEVIEPEEDLRQVLSELGEEPVLDDAATGLLARWLGVAHIDQTQALVATTAFAQDALGALLGEAKGQYSEGELAARAALGGYERIAGSQSELVAFARVRLGAILAMAGRNREAEDELQAALAFYESWLPRPHFYRAIPRLWLGVARLQEEEPEKALVWFQDARANCAPACPSRFETVVLAQEGHAMFQLGRTEEAIGAFKAAIQNHQTHGGTSNIASADIQVGLADALRAAGRQEEAVAVLGNIDRSLFKNVERHPTRAALLRAEGLQMFEGDDLERAHAALAESLLLTQQVFGDKHWRSKRLERELAMVRAKL